MICKEKIKKLIDEYIIGMINCNMPNIDRSRALLHDFYNTKIKDYKDYGDIAREDYVRVYRYTAKRY